MALITAFAVILTAWLEVGGRALRDGMRLMEAEAHESYGLPKDGRPESHVSRTSAGQDYAAYFHKNIQKLWPRTRSAKAPRAAKK